MKIVLASNNAGKAKEFEVLLKPFDIQLIRQAELGVEEADETGLSFVENAIIKARHAASVTGFPALADDSGLVVPALNDEPGIYSARYAGAGASPEQHIHKLLNALKTVPPDKRHAYFYCALVLIHHPEDPTPLIATGKWEGMISDGPKGKQGFGYDPVFLIPEENKTAAELESSVKNHISHRGKALQYLINHLQDKLYECTLS